MLALLGIYLSIKASQLNMNTTPILEARCGVVTEICHATETEDLVTFECFNGNIFSFYSDSYDYDTGDVVSCIMDTKGTDIVYDDEVIYARYDGHSWF